jgi:hypothetical protein
MPSDRWSPGSEFLHELKGNNPSAWHSWVETLTQAGRRVRYKGPPEHLPNGNELMLATDAVYAMLIGYAIECSLKGLWVRAGNKVIDSGRYIGVIPEGATKRIKDHQLGQLARVVCKAAGLVIEPDELNILDRLSSFVIFAGRYPVSLRPDDMKPITIPGRGKQVPQVFLRADCEVAERVLNRFTRALNPFLPPLERIKS